MCFLIFPDSDLLTCSGMGNYSGKSTFQAIIMDVQSIRHNLTATLHSRVEWVYKMSFLCSSSPEGMCLKSRCHFFFLAAEVTQNKINVRCWSYPSFIITVREIVNGDRFTIADTDLPVLLFTYMAFCKTNTIQQTKKPDLCCNTKYSFFRRYLI